MFADLSATAVFILLAVAAAVVAVLVGLLYRRLRAAEEAAEQQASGVEPSASPPPELGAGEAPIDYSTEATAAAVEQAYRLAFSAGRNEYQITAPHELVLQQVGENVASSIHDMDYFPRRPMLLPRLLQAINDTEHTRQHLVNLILEDPTLAGAVLQRANSAFYRVSPAPVERLDRAVAMLGAAGLRGLMATAIMQPVFRVPKGYFEAFADITWEHARRSAQAAEACAQNDSRADRTSDPFVAQLLGLLGSLAGIVLFRLTMDKYREQPTLSPRAEVFITVMQRHRSELAGMIVRSWKLSDMSVLAADEQIRKLPPPQMSPLGQAMYYGELCGALAVLNVRGDYAAEAATQLLTEQGLAPETAAEAWRAATAESTV
jgi:HD-like signal output (HDOD) protein